MPYRSDSTSTQRYIKNLEIKVSELEDLLGKKQKRTERKKAIKRKIKAIKNSIVGFFKTFAVVFLPTLGAIIVIFSVRGMVAFVQDDLHYVPDQKVLSDTIIKEHQCQTRQ